MARLRTAFLELHLPESMRAICLRSMTPAKEDRRPLFRSLWNEDGWPRGLVFFAPFGIKDRTPRRRRPPELDRRRCKRLDLRFALVLQEHSHDVERKAEDFANARGLPPDRVTDLKLSGFLHDQGKTDFRFQAWLHFGDPLGFDPDDEKDILAKSGRTLPPSSREKRGCRKGGATRRFRSGWR